VAKIAFSMQPTAGTTNPRPFRLPLAVIDIHTSLSTSHRAAGAFRLSLRAHPLVANGTFVIRYITSQLVSMNCRDVRNGESGLVCRVEGSYRTFLRDFPDCNWLFRAVDDTFVHLWNFYAWLVRLNGVYGAEEQIIFRAHANFEHEIQYYIHGGTGWLMSRGYLQFHRSQNLSLISLLSQSKYRQDDTAQSIIVRKLFTKPILWDEMLLNGFKCINCGQTEKVRRCPVLKVCARVGELIAVHKFGNADVGLALAALVDTAPSELMFYRDNPNQAIHLCSRRRNFLVHQPNTRSVAVGDPNNFRL
jgi:hypothetical protein